MIVVTSKQQAIGTYKDTMELTTPKKDTFATQQRVFVDHFITKP